MAPNTGKKKRRESRLFFGFGPGRDRGGKKEASEELSTGENDRGTERSNQLIKKRKERKGHVLCVCAENIGKPMQKQAKQKKRRNRRGEKSKERERNSRKKEGARKKKESKRRRHGKRK